MKRKGTVYKKMLLSFVAVFCLPLLMCALFYFYSGHVMEEQMELSNTNLLHSVRSICDQKIEFYKNILRKHAADRDVKDLGKWDQYDGYEYSSMDEFQDGLSDSVVLMDSFDGVSKELFIYFPKMGYIFSEQNNGMMMFSTYQSGIFNGQVEHIEPFLEALGRRSVFSATVLHHPDFNKKILLVTRT